MVFKNQLHRLLLSLVVILCAHALNAAANQQSLDLSVPDPQLHQTLSLDDIRHLASRTGFGVSAQDIQRFAGLTKAEAIDNILTSFTEEPYLPMPEWALNVSPKHWMKPDLDQESRRQFNQARDRELAQLRQWWISNMLQTPSPQTERMVLFWHDHFATSYNGLHDGSILVARQNQLFRQQGMGSLEQLLKSMIRDPALLLYLNNNQNKKGKPNENLGRELLELFTLGEGNYQEATVKEAARSLTGYTFGVLADNQFRLEPWNHDSDDKTLFGVVGKHNGDALVELILQQPAAAEFIVGKFWSAFVSDQIPGEQTLQSFSKQFRDSGYNITLLYSNLLSSTAFWHRDTRAALIKSPVSLVVGTARSLDFPKSDWQQMPSIVAKLGMNLFAPPNVSGWSEGEAFVAPGRLLGRYRYLNDVANGAKKKQGNASLAKHSTAAGSSMMAGSMQEGQMQEGQMQEGQMQEGQMQEGQMQDTGMMDAKAMSGVDLSGVVQVKLAAENYQGVAEYQIDVLKGKKSFWQSRRLRMDVGHDTEKYGRIQSDSSLPWQTVRFDLGAELVASATAIRVRFLNDHAGSDGDRNLYVSGAQIGLNWVDAATGTQKSGCEPENSAYSGNLYCAGYVLMPVADGRPMQPYSDKIHDYSASSAHLVWVNNPKPGKGTRRVHIALADLVTPYSSFDTFSFELLQERDGKFYLSLANFNCAPDCLKEWPECAWEAEGLADLKSISVALVPDSNDGRYCHYKSLNAEDKELVSVLWMSAGDLLGRVKNTRRGQRREKPLSAWLKQRKQIRSHLSESIYASATERVHVDAALAPAVTKSSDVVAPVVAHTNLASLHAALAQQGLVLEDLLFPGLDRALATELLAGSDPALEWETLSVSEKLDSILRHPLYQVH
ncbi:MAG: DUF1800 family protein [Gammaproteobacteria bacterium]|nr:DUF1800 family protein [Gammaproteobacteria bacterium]